MVVNQAGIHLSGDFWGRVPFDHDGMFHEPGSHDQELSAFSLEQMGMPFILLAVGTAVAGLAFGVERITNRLS